MKIKVISISDSDKHFVSAIEEYCKRLGKDVDIITLKPEKNGSRDQIIAKETEKIIEKIATIKDSYTILLAKE
jgi:23S rRNA pseudoU1915 N3-methylase RlmH